MELIIFVVIVEGVVLGLLFGPLGILIEALLPAPPPPVKLPRVTPQESERWRA